jgi:hypothetical protein
MTSTLERWIRESCDARPGDKSLKAPSYVLFASWNAHAWATRTCPMRHTTFARELERLGFTYVRRKGMRTWHGISLRKAEIGAFLGRANGAARAPTLGSPGDSLDDLR